MVPSEDVRAPVTALYEAFNKGGPAPGPRTSPRTSSASGATLTSGGKEAPW